MPRDWKRLADYVIARRTKLGHKDRGTFATASGITERTLWNLENGRSVSAPTLAAVADTLGWSPDSPRLILDGREPVERGGTASPLTPREEQLLRMFEQFLRDTREQ